MHRAHVRPPRRDAVPRRRMAGAPAPCVLVITVQPARRVRRARRAGSPVSVGFFRRHGRRRAQSGGRGGSIRARSGAGRWRWSPCPTIALTRAVDVAAVHRAAASSPPASPPPASPRPPVGCPSSGAVRRSRSPVAGPFLRRRASPGHAGSRVAPDLTTRRTGAARDVDARARRRSTSRRARASAIDHALQREAHTSMLRQRPSSVAAAAAKTERPCTRGDAVVHTARCLRTPATRCPRVGGAARPP